MVEPMRKRRGLIPIKYLNCHTLKLISKIRRGIPKSIKDAEVLLIENRIIQTTLPSRTHDSDRDVDRYVQHN